MTTHYNTILLRGKSNIKQAMFSSDDDESNGLSFGSMEDEESTDDDVTIGYQESDIECSMLDTDTLRDIEANNTYVDGVEVNCRDWISGAGIAIGNSQVLRRIEINVRGNNSRWLDELFQGLSRNQSITQFQAHSMNSDNAQLHNFPILAPFFECNSNLCIIQG